MKTVLFAPEVEEDLFELTKILVDKQYLGTPDYAVSYVRSLILYIREHIDSLPHKDAPSYFDKYGHDAKYLIYKRNSNTTWYIIFVERANAYLVTHITNNHISGQYFNQ